MNGERLVMSDKRGKALLVPFMAALSVLLLLLLLASCERRDLTYYEVSEISLTADWSKAGLDEQEALYGATAVFYPQDGGTPFVFLMGERDGTTVRLPEGVYNVVLFNRSFNDFSNISFRGADRYETLEAYARKVETRIDEHTRTETRTIVGSPDALAVATLEGFTVTEDMLGNYSQTTYGRTPARTSTVEADDLYTLHFTPRKLTSKVVAVLYLPGLNNIRTATCRLSGVSESVFLASGKFSGRTAIQEFAPSNPEFTPGSPFDGTLSGTFEVFGFNLADARSLHLETLLVDGTTTFKGDYDDVKVTKDDNGEGLITLRVEVTTDKVPDVKPEGGSDSGFDVDVDGWGDNTNTDIPIN